MTRNFSKLAFIGECMFELSGNSLQDVRCSYGGDTLNTAIYYSRLTQDSECFFISAVGSDSLSQMMKNEWVQEGINCSCVLEDDKHNCGVYSVSVDECGERSFRYWRKDSAARTLLKHADYPKVNRALVNMDVVFLSGISLAILSNADRQRLLEHLSLLHDQGVKIVVDTNYRPILWEGAEMAKRSTKALLALADIALVSLDDESLLWGDAKAKDTAQRIKALGVNTVVVKNGSSDLFVCDTNSEGETEFSSFSLKKISSPVDTTAAGDSFNAGFLARYFAGDSILKACEFGGKVASQVIGYQGAIVPAVEFIVPEV